jgi:voltage-gated potassium channel
VTPGSISPRERDRVADELLDRLTPVMSGLGVLFLLLVLAERSARPGTGLATAFTLAGWLLWAVFVLEFIARAVVAPSAVAFLRRNWWQVIFLVLPFLRALRLVRSFRLLRTGRVMSSAIRSSRSTRRVLSDRLAWLAMVTAIVVLTSAELLDAFGVHPTYGDALHAAALAATTGEPFGRDEVFARLLEVALAVYSVVVFATLAGSIGAFFLEARASSVAATPDRDGAPGLPESQRVP